MKEKKKKRLRVTFRSPKDLPKNEKCPYCYGTVTLQAQLVRIGLKVLIACCSNDRCKKLASECCRRNFIKNTI